MLFFDDLPDLVGLDIGLFGLGIHGDQQYIFAIDKIVDHAIATAFSAPGIGVAHPHLVDGMTGTLDVIAWPLTGGKVIDERLDVDADAPDFWLRRLS